MGRIEEAIDRSSKRPKKPIGSFYSEIHKDYVVTTDKKGMLNVNNMVLFIGSNLTSVIPSQYYKSPNTEYLSEFFKK